MDSNSKTYVSFNRKEVEPSILAKQIGDLPKDLLVGANGDVVTLKKIDGKPEFYLVDVSGKAVVGLPSASISAFLEAFAGSDAKELQILYPSGRILNITIR